MTREDVIRALFKKQGLFYVWWNGNTYHISNTKSDYYGEILLGVVDTRKINSIVDNAKNRLQRRRLLRKFIEERIMEV